MRVTAIAAGALICAGCVTENVAHKDVTNSLVSAQGVRANEGTYPSPTSLTVSRTGAGFVSITWGRPFGLSLLTRAYVYRSATNDFTTATLVTSTIVPFYHDLAAGPGTTYYWVRYGDGTNFGPTVFGSVSRGPSTISPPVTAPPVVGESQAYIVSPASLRAHEAPVLVTDDAMQVGSARPPATSDLRRFAKHDDITMYRSRVQDGVSARTLQHYLSTDATNAGSSYVLLFKDAPTVRIQKGASRNEIREVAHAVQLINYQLPFDWQLNLDLTPIENDGQPENGNIVVEYSDRATWASPVVGETIGKARKWYLGSTIRSAEVWVDPGRSDDTLATLVHELLHALGRDHVSESTFPNTLMHTTAKPTPGHVMHALDEDALFGVYGVIGKATGQTTVAAELGEWADTSMHIVGETDHMRFGAATRNGFARAWAAGERPLYPLADNPSLRGSASWNGRLVGFTPDEESVAGAMDMSVGLFTMIGSLDFTDMEKWSTGAAMRSVGSGRMWNEGSLHYAIRVDGNNFLKMAGDDGNVTGAFFGAEHEGAGGTLRRDDLTAAFGGIRDGVDD